MHFIGVKWCREACDLEWYLEFPRVIEFKGVLTEKCFFFLFVFPLSMELVLCMLCRSINRGCRSINRGKSVTWWGTSRTLFTLLRILSFNRFIFFNFLATLIYYWMGIQLKLICRDLWTSEYEIWDQSMIFFSLVNAEPFRGFFFTFFLTSNPSIINWSRFWL